MHNHYMVWILLYHQFSFGGKVVYVASAVTVLTKTLFLQLMFELHFRSGLLLMRTSACGLGTDLPSVTAVVLHDSDWNPR